MKPGAYLGIIMFVFCSVCVGYANLERVPNTTLQLPPAPPTFGYAITNAFGNVTFTNPVSIVNAPGDTNRLFVVEQRGYITVITNLDNPNRSVFLDLTSRVQGGVPSDERGLLGMAFHPGYATNRYLFVFYTGVATTAVPGGTNSLHDIIARYEVSAANSNVALAGSEVRLIAQRDEANNHNAGDMHFGSDGYLYVALGDEGGGNDTYNNSQTITKDYFSGIIRIDVDSKAGNLAPNAHPSVVGNYLVPADNPFVGATSFNGVAVNPGNVRTEFWAVGLRNPWRFHFDRATGHVYCADVGQNVWEEINIIVKGGNYGWAYREGLGAGPKTAPPGFTHINPIQQYSHGSGVNQGFSVTGGVVYRGSRMSQLAGGYVFADYVSGNVWVLRYDGTNTVPMQRLTAEGGIAGFGVDPRNGDILMANQTSDRIRRLVYSSTVVGAPIPPTLAGTGAFTNLTTLAPAPGIVGYDLNVPFWSDGAVKSRWFSVPNTNLTMGYSREGNWSFPTGTVWIKHFELELTNGVAESRKRLETRFIVRNVSGVYGVTYRWGNQASNADLVPEEGLDETFVVDDGGGVVRTQVWRYPSRQECLVCHTAVGGLGLGFNTAQLNREYDYGGGMTNQIGALSAAGYFSGPVSESVTLPALAHPTNGAVSLEYRVRSYLAANCVNCHQPGGVPQSTWDARVSTPTALAGLVNGLLVDDWGDAENRVIKPGAPEKSMILTRVSTLGAGRMPPVASSVLDEEGIGLLRAWITNDLPGYETFGDWQLANFGSTNAVEAGVEADPDGDRARNSLEYLTGTDPKVGSDYWRFEIDREGGGVRLVVPMVANRVFEVQSSGSLDNPASWVPLQVVGNEPLYSVTNRVREIRVVPGDGQRFYRVRVDEP